LMSWSSMRVKCVEALNHLQAGTLKNGTIGANNPNNPNNPSNPNRYL
jgi:hypothetical protein